MAKLARAAIGAGLDAQSLRLRAAWLYYVHGLTQKDIADRIGVARTTVVKWLDEALKRGEVRIRIASGGRELLDLAVRLEDKLALDEAIVVPSEPGPDATAKAVGAALGSRISEAVLDGMTVGVGWGRTLTASLGTFAPPPRRGVKVVSLLGGVVQVAATNPPEFAWRLASLLGAECYLFPAPLIVDSADTRERLMTRCGLDRLERIAGALDIAVVSVGDISPAATSLARELLTKRDVQELCAAGCVADALCTFIDAEGRSVDHPLNRRVMSISLDTVARARRVVIATGGAARAEAILAARRRLGAATLITDEAAARRLLALVA